MYYIIFLFPPGFLNKNYESTQIWWILLSNVGVPWGGLKDQNDMLEDDDINRLQ